MPIRRGLAACAAGLAALLAGLGVGLGLGPRAILAGLLSGALLLTVVARALIAGGSRGLGPGDVVTLSRATLACGLAALVVHSYLQKPVAAAVVVLAAVALALDAVDGPVARRSGTASAFGARFDGEADAFVLLVLSAYVAPSAGRWVLAIGLARYVFGALGLVMPWLAQPLPFRYWRKVVTAVQGIALCVAAAGVLPPGLRTVLLVGALVLLTESFGRDVVWLWHRRPARAPLQPRTAPPAPAP